MRYKGKEAKNGLYWCNIIVNKKYKLVIGELIDKKNEIFKLRSNIQLDNSWKIEPKRNDWYYKEVLEEEINEFFTFNH